MISQFHQGVRFSKQTRLLPCSPSLLVLYLPLDSTMTLLLLPGDMPLLLLHTLENFPTSTLLSAGSSIALIEFQNFSLRVQGDTNQNLVFQMALPLKESNSDPMLVKPKLV